MCSQNDFGFTAKCVLDGGDSFADAGVIRDRAFFGERNIEVHADEDALAGEVEITNRKPGHCYEDN